MVSSDDVKHLFLTGVTSTGHDVGRGDRGIVFKVDYNGTTWAAKQVHVSGAERKRDFHNECLLHSKLDHRNIVKMLGVYFSSEGDVLPVLVMELMEYSLTTLLEKSQDIPVYVKMSILQDISRGVHYLHTLNPPVIHRNLNSTHVLLNNNLVVKLCSFGIAKRMPDSLYLSDIPMMTRAPSTILYMPPEALSLDTQYGLPLDVFSFGCIVCHVISQQWPQPSIPTQEDPITHKRIAVSEVLRRQHYIDLITDGSLTQLVISCLDNDPKRRPPISQVCRTITSIITGHYSNDDSIKIAYSLAMKERLAESRDLQVLVVGAENTGKSCLVSSFLGEEFVEGRAATEAVEADVCKIYCKDWTRISHSDKTDLLHHQFVDQLRGKVVKEMMLLKATDNATPSSRPAVKYGSEAVTSPPATATSSSNSSKHFPEPHPQNLQEASSNTSQYDPDSLNLVLWDFPGQVIFHNTNSVFISANGVVTITFNASMKLTGEVVPRKGSHAPPECATIISSIHYWLQVVDSMCSVEGREGDLSPLQPPVILAGTHIDLLHPDIKVARKIAKEMIIPLLEKEFFGKRYARHLVGMDKDIKVALERFCFFVSNKCRDEEIECLKNTTIKAATSLKTEQPIYFLKIERALLQHKEQVISKSEMVEVVAQSTFPIAENSSEFESVLRYFHDKRVILYFSQIESLKNLVILSPRWLARLFSYIITAHSYKRGKEFDEAWKRLTKYGILHDDLLQHMLDKFHSDYPCVVKISKKQVVDVLLCFHLVARITREAWFSEEGYPPLPDSGDTFIVPSLVPCDDKRNPPNTKQERIIYFKFVSGFIPTSLPNQLIADCICRNVRRNNRLLWMRHGKVGLQLGADQVYYIIRCEGKNSIQLTITMPVKDDVKSTIERRELIDDITKLLDDIMKVFMPAVKKRPVLLVPCPNCPTLHITLDEVIPSSVLLLVKLFHFVDTMTTCYLIHQSLSYEMRILRKKPLKEHLVEFVIPKIYGYWEDIAYILGYDTADAHGIKAKFPDDVKKRCRELLIYYWLNTGCGPKTWSALLTNLRRLEELTAITEKIEQKLQELSVVEKYM